MNNINMIEVANNHCMHCYLVKVIMAHQSFFDITFFFLKKNCNLGRFALNALVLGVTGQVFRNSSLVIIFSFNNNNNIIDYAWYLDVDDVRSSAFSCNSSSKKQLVSILLFIVDSINCTLGFRLVH